MYKNGKLTEVTYSSGIADKVRKQITADKKGFLGMCVQVEMQTVLHNKDGSYGIQNPRIAQIREDKNEKECTFQQLIDIYNKHRGA